MIPLKDNQPTSSFPIITIVLIVVNVLVYILQQVSQITDVYTLVPAELLRGADVRLIPVRQVVDVFGQVHTQYQRVPAVHPAWITIFTSMFMHGGLMHIGGNMLYLWIFGNNIEDALGKIKFILFYFACGIAAAFLQIAVNPFSHTPMLGASGAIAGVLGAYLILYPGARVLSIVPIIVIGTIMEVPAWIVLGLWFVIQVAQGIFGWGEQSGVAVFAHIGGFIAGVALIKAMGGQMLVSRQQSRVQYYPPGNGPYNMR